jgi:hypothetical protein
MTKHEILQDFGVIFLMWAAVLFGVLTVPENIVSPFFKYVFSLVDTLLFAIFGAMYFRSGYFRERWKKVASMKPTLAFWLMGIVELISIGGYVSAAAITFQVFSLNGVFVVTYSNVLFVLFCAITLFLAYDFWRRLVNRYKGRKERARYLT